MYRNLLLVCIAAFLYLIDYTVKSLRPVNVLLDVAFDGSRVIESIYPEPLAE